MCGTGSRPPKCMGSAVYGPGGCTCGTQPKVKRMNEDMEPCPACGALPCDQVDAKKAKAMRDALAEVLADNDAVGRLSWIDKAAGALA